MKVRQKITLWITGTGVLASLVFSLIVFFAMLGHPYRLIDAELETMARSLVHYAEKAGNPRDEGFSSASLPFDTHRYWIRARDADGRTLFQSDLARYTELPWRLGQGDYLAERTIPRDLIDLNQDAHDGVLFRVGAFTLPLHGRQVEVLVGKPIERLEEEIIDLGKIIGAGLLFTTLLLIGLSYAIAGRILKPVSVITHLAREINDRTLDRRIPLGKSRDELHDLAAALNRMFDRLQYSFAQQKEFLANASHELKSPITLLLLFLEDAVQQRDLPASFKYRLGRQTDILRRMSRLVKNLLDLSALKLKESLEFRKFDLAALLQGILEDYGDVLAAKNIRLRAVLPGEFPFRGDVDTLQRAVINLLDNATRYNENGGEIEIALAEKDGAAHLCLANTGQSIPEEDIGHVFEQFYRVEKSRSQQHGGSGLGLSIVKRIIDLHGGSIGITSEKNGLTRVDIVLPQSGPT